MAERRPFEMDFPHQFVLSRETRSWKEGWQLHTRGSFILQSDPLLPVWNLLDETGEHVGFALGWPIAASAKLPSADIQIPFRVTPQVVGRIEDFIYEFSGRYVFVILADSCRRLYLDPQGSLAVVFDSSRKTAGSTVSVLALHDQDHPIWSMPTGVFPDNRPMQYFPAGLTPDPSVRRILPNHYLDLDSWQTERHFPKSFREWTPQSEIASCVEEIIACLRTTILAAVNSAPRVYMTLTAGHDSRMALACSKDVCNHIEYVTFDYRALRNPVGTSTVDVEIPRQFARQLGLKHCILPAPETPPEGTRIGYLRRIGFAGGGGKARDFFWTCRQHLDMSGAWLTGFMGEIGRAKYLQRLAVAPTRLTAREILDMMTVDSSDEFVSAIDTWLAELPDVPAETVLDLVMIEFCMGCWGAPHMCGAAPFAMNLALYSHRRVIDQMLRLQPGYKRDEGLVRDIISRAWPQLPDLPFNLKSTNR